MEGATIRCCLCGGDFDERALEGAWLDRRCPLCDSRLTEEAYDAAAADVIARHRPALGRKGARSLERLALARYYTSEWFRLACAGQGSKAADKGLFGLVPGYDPATGAFTLEPGDEDRSPEGGLGTSAEYFTFEALRREITAPGSPLANTRLLPALVFPWLPGQKPKQWGARHRAETDCVILNEFFACIVEVKRRNHHVRVSRNQAVRECTESGSYRSASEPLEQVQRGADSFAERQRLYPRERIYRLVVYVEPLSFEGGFSSFRDRLLVSWVGSDGSAQFTKALLELTRTLSPIAAPQQVSALAEELLDRFGNTKERRVGRILIGNRTLDGSRQHRTSAMLRSIEARCEDDRSPLHGSHLLTNLLCEVQVDRRERRNRKSGENGTAPSDSISLKRVDIPGLLLTRTHAIFIDAKRWPVHVNTHASFATVYTGDPAEGAEIVEADIRHDWDLDAICYKNRSHSLTLPNYVSKCMPEVDAYRERNRVSTMHVFIDPASFVTDGDTFRQKAFIGFWRGGREGDNILEALEAYVSGAEPIMTQAELDRFANRLARVDEAL